MKILHLIYDHPQNPWLGGGGAKGTLAIAQYMEQNGHTTTIICGKFKSDDPLLQTGHIQYKKVGWGINYLISRISYTIGSFLYVWRNLKKYNLIVDDTSPFSPTFSFLFSQRVPVIATIRNVFGSHVLKKGIITGIPAFISEFMILRAYSCYIVVSPYMKDSIPRRKTCEIIPNGINFAEIPSHLPAKKSYIAFLGRIEIYQKGLDIALRALGDLKQLLQRNDIICKFAGSGKDSNKFQSLIKEQELTHVCEYIGRLEGEDKYLFLAQALFIIAPSRFEAMPRVPLEAQACGTPVIASSIPSFKYVIKADESGILIKPESTDELKNAIINLIENTEKRMLYSNGALEHSKLFDRDVFMKQRLELYTKISQQKANKNN
ncbi:MAG: glycosyltransferase [Chitinivibrionales bacterium]|nr:glycosyltransferase [Chitinivibrionales bacterium]